MVGVVIGVILLAIVLVVILAVRRQGQAAIDVGRLSEGLQDAHLTVMDRAAEAAAALTVDATVASRLSGFTLAALSSPGPASGRADHEHQLLSLQDDITGMGRRAAEVSAASSSLTALASARAAGAGGPETSLSAAFTLLASLAGESADAGELAGVLGRLRATGPQPTPAEPMLPDVCAATERLVAALRPADPHADARAALMAGMARLGLDTEWPGLPGWAAYGQLNARYEAGLGSGVRELADRVRAAREQAAAALATAIRPTLTSQDGNQEAERLARELRTATKTYAGQVQAVLSAAVRQAAPAGGPQAGAVDGAGSLTGRLATVTTVLTRCDEHLASHDVAAAVATLAGVRLPIVASWQPSRTYQASWENAAGRLREVADLHPVQTVRAIAKAVAELQTQASLLCASIESAIRQWRRQQDSAWEELEQAAGTVKQNAARALRDPATSHDAAGPVRAAAAVMCVDDVAAVSLVHAVRGAIPEANGHADPEDVEGRLSAVSNIVGALDRNAVALAGIDGLLIPLLSATVPASGQGLAAAMAQLSPVKPELASTWHDLVTMLHHPLSGVSFEGMSAAFIHAVEQSITPGPGSLLSILSGGEDNPLTYLDLVKDFGKDLGKAYVHANPVAQHGQGQLDLVGHHVMHAAGLAAPDILGGVAGHIPYVTLALSTIREVRLYRDGKTTLDQAIVNVAIDTGGVFAGVTAAELGVHLIAGAHPAGIITIPAGIAGSVIARKLIQRHRRKPFNEAMEAYTALTAAYSGKALELAKDLSDTAQVTVGRERSRYLATIGVPALAQQAAAGELERLTTRLRVATVDYAGTVRALLEAGNEPSPGSLLVVPGAAGAAGAVAQVADAARACDAQARDGWYAPALLTLTRENLPVPESWRPGREYRELCRQTALRITDISDENRAGVARWATGATAEFRKRNEAIGTTLSPKLHAVQQESAAARAAIEQAAATVQREAEAAHIKLKPA